MKAWRLETCDAGRWRVIEDGCPEYYADAKYFRSREKAEQWLRKRVEHDRQWEWRAVDA